MPKAIDSTVSSVITARPMPTRVWPLSISLTKLISGIPGMMNSVQAISGCQGVWLERKSGRLADTAACCERRASIQAISVEKNVTTQVTK